MLKLVTNFQRLHIYFLSIHFLGGGKITFILFWLTRFKILSFFFQLLLFIFLLFNLKFKIFYQNVIFSEPSNLLFRMCKNLTWLNVVTIEICERNTYFFYLPSNFFNARGYIFLKTNTCFGFIYFWMMNLGIQVFLFHLVFAII